MASSTLPASALQASKAALSAALAENEIKVTGNGDAPLEEGEIQEVDMQAQAENIRTVFNDPKNFNVKVCFPLSATVPVRLRRPHCPRPAPAVLAMDPLVRLTGDQGSQSAANPHDLVPTNPLAGDPWRDRGPGLDGGYQARHQLR